MALGTGNPEIGKREAKRGTAPSADGVTVYEGGFVFLDEDGKATPVARGNVFAGVAESTVNNTVASSTEKRVEYFTGPTLEIGLKGTGFTQANAATRPAVYAEDDEVVALTQDTDRPLIGYLRSVSQNTAYIRLDG